MNNASIIYRCICPLAFRISWYKISPMMRSSSGDRFVALHGIGITRLGRRVLTKAGDPMKAHRHPGAIELSFVARGEFTQGVRIGSAYTYYLLNGGSAQVLFPDEQHGTGDFPRGKSLFYYVVIPRFGKGNFLGLGRSLSVSLTRRLSSLRGIIIRRAGFLQPSFERLITLCTERPDGYRAEAPLLCADMLMRLCRIRDEQERRTPAAADAAQYLAEHCTEQVSSSMIAEKMGVSVAHAYAVFKQDIGMTPHDYQLRVRIERAKELLSKGTRSVTDIAYDLSFSSSQYFAVVFRRFTGMTPAAWRKRNTSDSIAKDVRHTRSS